MRLCLVSRELAPFHGSGIGVYAAEAARAWAAAGHEVHVITADHPGLAGQGGMVLPGVVLHAVDLQEGPASHLPEPLGAAQWPLGAYDRLVRLHERLAFEYAEFADFAGEGYFAAQGRRLLPGRSAGLPGCVLGVRLHMPAMLIDHANERTWRGRLRAYLAHMEVAVIRQADIIFAPCRAVIDALAALGVPIEGPEAPPVVVSRNPFTAPALPPISQPEPQGHEAPGQEIVFFGRLERRKGPDVLVRAAVDLMRALPGLRVRLIGGDTDTGPLDAGVVAWLEQMIPADLRSRILLDGAMDRERCIGIARAATVTCFPARWDNWPYAMLESMAMGSCIVAADSGGHAEMLEHDRTALLVPPGDAGALAAALHRALDDEALRTRLGAAAREAALRLGDPERFAAETIDAVARAAEARNQPSDPAPPSLGPEQVAVVIPFKDMPDDLPDALASLAAQTVRGFTTILVDDGSTNPRSEALLARLEAGESPVPLRIIRQRCAGPAAARNAGIRATTHPVVLTLDADDVLAPAHIESCLCALSARPELACVGALVSYFEEHPDRPTGAWAPLGLVRDMLPAMNTMGTGSGIAFRRAALDAVRPDGPYDPSMPGYEDWDLYCALAAAGMKGDILPELLIHYRVRPGSRYHGKDRLRHDRLVAELAARHPALPENPGMAMRLLLAEAKARQQPARRRLRRITRERNTLRRRIRLLQGRLAELRSRLAAQRRASTRDAQTPAHNRPDRADRGPAARVRGGRTDILRARAKRLLARIRRARTSRG